MTIDRTNNSNKRSIRKKNKRTGETIFNTNSREDCNTGNCEACWYFSIVSDTQTKVYLTNNFTFGGFQLDFSNNPNITDVNGTDVIENLPISYSSTEFSNHIVAFNISGAEVDALTGEHVFTVTHDEGVLNLLSSIVSSYSDMVGGMGITTESSCCDNSCSENCQTGDMNCDGGWNVLDIVALVNCVLGNNCSEAENGYVGDTNCDGGFNVLDVVILVNCVLNNNCDDLPDCNRVEGSLSSRVRGVKGNHYPPPGMTKAEQDRILNKILSVGENINEIKSILDKEVGNNYSKPSMRMRWERPHPN